MAQFKRVLIANRGEIALRVVRALKKLGIEAVAIYSDPDIASRYLAMADRAFHLPGAYAAETYLRGDKIVEIALRAECDAIHPGYGFLSESAEFSKLCADSGIKFIGPSPDTLLLSGNKLQCKKIVESHGIPVIPYSKEPIDSVKEATCVAANLGYPVLLKNAFGGGGKGIREASSDSDIREAFEASQREAKSSFGKYSVYIEKKLLHPRHIEMQVLAEDGGTGIIHLGERECSIQRRYQKLVEISPSPIMDEKAREELSKYALKIARLVNYSNAGTIEFLRDSSSGKFYFIEINSRLQVEHPVTEAVTGIDLVAAQIEIASKKKLPFRQNDICFSGAAIECRINAEDPLQDFSPVSGAVDFVQLPSGPGIRVDTALREGLEITPYYDSLVAKLIATGHDFEEARRRAIVALDEFWVAGIETTIAFHKRVLSDSAFILGKLSTGFIEERDIIGKLKAEAMERDLVPFGIAALLRTYKHYPGSEYSGTTAKSHMPRRLEAAREKNRGRFIDAL